MKKIFALFLTSSILAGSALLSSANSATAALFNQCPAVAGLTGCSFLITQNADGSLSTALDLSQPGYGGEDQLVGVLNNSAKPLLSLNLTANNLFGFDGDGPYPVTALAPTGYEGPNVSFTYNPANPDTGTVNFLNAGLSQGQSAYFGLEELASINTTVAPGGRTAVPEPFTVIGTLIGGTAAFRMRKKLKAIAN